MRSRAEILTDGLEAVKEETVLTQSDLKLSLLTLEALVDIRDILNTKTEQIVAAQATILDNL